MLLDSYSVLVLLENLQGRRRCRRGRSGSLAFQLQSRWVFIGNSVYRIREGVDLGRCIYFPKLRSKLSSILLSCLRGG